jgi:hypothetical protein
MSTWKCKYFESKETDSFPWNPHLENCGLCINWLDTKCRHEDWLKQQGENDQGKETYNRNPVITSNDDNSNRSSYGY